MKKFTVPALLICIAFAANSQNVVSQQYLYWTRYQQHITFSPTLYLNNEFDNRRFFNPDIENQLIIHSHVHYKKKKWDFAGGLTLSWTFAQKPELGYEHATNEIRGVMEASYEVAMGKLSFQNRIRFDHRFFQENTEQSVFEASYYVLRFRYRPLLKIPLYIDQSGIPIINLRLSDEVMVNHTKNTFDQNRIYVNTDFYLSKKFTLDLGYIYIYQQRFGTDEYFQRHVARFTILHKIQ